ncbi:MAG: amino acid permease [Armatimonadetes bacterium]|nr:amino acid permease [Armatimonadota bacterium]
MGEHDSKADREDVQDLHSLGYAQLLLRDIGGFASFAISFSIISFITGAAGLYGYGIKMSGPFGLITGWLLVSIFALAMAASMAEIASAIPTAGAMYHWATFIGNRGWGWFTGWANVIGCYAILAGIDYSMAQFTAPLLGISTQAGILWLTAALLASHGLFCTFGIRLCAWLNDFSAWYHIALVCAMVLGVLLRPHAPWSQLWSMDANPASLTLDPVPAYNWLFMLGLLPAMWIFTGYDASAHISEETHSPRVNAPWGIYMAVAVSAAAGWLMMVALTLGISDLSAVLNAKDGTEAFLLTLSQAYGEQGGRVMWCLIAGAMWFCGLSSTVCGGRTIYAFARDRGMPGWKVWGSVSPRWRTPVWATWQVVVVAMLLILYIVWSKGDISAITATAAISLYVCYGLPVLLRLLARARGTWTSRFDGPWSLGAWSTPVNVVAVLWVGVICLIFMAPPNNAVGPLFGWLVGGLAFVWFALERRRFVGPRRLGTEEELYEMEHAVEEEVA